MVQQRLDMQSYIYISNMAKAIRRCGEIWLSMAQEVYVEPQRRMKTIGNQAEVEMIELMAPGMDETGEVIYENDLSEAKMDVWVDIGPTSTSKRQATVRALTGMLQITQDPETAQVLQAMALMNMEGEGIQEVREFFRSKLLRMGVIKPTEEEAEQLAQMLQGQTDPIAVFLQAAAEEAIAKAAQARANTVKTVADAELARAKTQETLSKIQNEDDRTTMDGLRTAREFMRQ